MQEQVLGSPLTSSELPALRCRVFIGQSGGKKTVGMKQSEQKKVLADFKAGKFNTLVATCIAEEGLDIAQVRPHICCDCFKVECAASLDIASAVLLWPAMWSFLPCPAAYGCTVEPDLSLTSIPPLVLLLKAEHLVCTP